MILTELGTIYMILKILATLIGLFFSGRKLYRWIRRRKRRKPPA